MYQKRLAEEMKQLSISIRIEMIKMLGELGFGHVGGAASIADVLAVLYGGVMNVDSSDPTNEQRDRLVLSKGHSAPALYAALALKNFFPMDWLNTLNKPGTRLPSHADARTVPGIDLCTGSLGQGLSGAAGICLANRIQNNDSWTYCIVGDGELNEGQIWEACETAAQYQLDHLICFVDWNKKQLDGRLEEVINPFDIAEKFRAFGFDAETVRGYDTDEIYKLVERVKLRTGKPHCIVLDTIKGIGIDFAEKQEFNHHIPCNPDACDAAIREIKRRVEEGNYPLGEKQYE